MSENPIKRAIDTDLSGLRTTAGQREQIVQYALEGQHAMTYRSKLRVSVVLAIALVMMTAVTALAVGLTNYFDGFMRLEEEYGEYEEWPGSAKVQLVELMLESGALTAEDAPQWMDDLTGEEKEAAAEEILGIYFDGMVYVDTYNAMTRVLGPIEQWTDEQRVMYTELLEKHGRLTDSWPVFQLPSGGDLTRDQAVARAKEALLSTYSIDPDYLNNLTPVDALFRADFNTYGIPEDEPYWTVQIGYGMTGHFVHMRRNGEIIALDKAGSGEVFWGEDILDRATLAEPSEYDVTREQAIANARHSLSEIMNIPFEDVDAMTATAQFFYHERFCFGEEPVWLVNWSRDGELQYRVLLGYDGSHIDVEPAGKQFDNVQRSELPISEVFNQYYAEKGWNDSWHLFVATLEERAAFSAELVPKVEEYAASHPYYDGTNSIVWESTRNINGIPDNQSIDASHALGLAMQSFEQEFGEQLESALYGSTKTYPIFYFVTNPDRPEWRVIGYNGFVALDAHTGEVLMQKKAVRNNGNNWNEVYVAQDFIAEIIE